MDEDPVADEELDDFENRGDHRMTAQDVRRLVAEIRWLRDGDWIESAATTIACDEEITRVDTDADAALIAEILRTQLKFASGR